MEIVTIKNTTEGDHPQNRITEASMLRIPPGKIPQELLTTLGNGLSLVLARYSSESFIYRQRMGSLTVRVFNT